MCCGCCRADPGAIGAGLWLPPQLAEPMTDDPPPQPALLPAGLRDLFIFCSRSPRHADPTHAFAQHHDRQATLHGGIAQRQHVQLAGLDALLPHLGGAPAECRAAALVLGNADVACGGAVQHRQRLQVSGIVEHGDGHRPLVFRGLGFRDLHDLLHVSAGHAGFCLHQGSFVSRFEYAVQACCRSSDGAAGVASF